MADIEPTRCGFRWGPGVVVRLSDDDKLGVWLLVGGARQSVEIRVTASGLLRVSKPKKTYRNDFELWGKK